MLSDILLIDLNTNLLEGIGSYCLRSKKKSDGYMNKSKWLNDRLEVGFRYVQLVGNKKQVGFIEYAESEYSSIVVHATDYLVILRFTVGK
ncbi:hypothetical protein PB01_11350 [Psychrobacillus glaciei]|uniref:Uncharacterized protein n=1 Tax=Psychrobacillus glaciei TaxID=2283160 RepID=A0A5J6SNK0_9BACI|nr:hypothetical protein [Psychrobacillus glaciei]QFF99369.1 hypothetical protein PB01_11350 [Psychrobacillus glaciei]